MNHYNLIVVSYLIAACAPVTLVVVLEKEVVVEEVLVVVSVAGALAFVLVPDVVAFLGSCFSLWRYFRKRAVKASLHKRQTRNMAVLIWQANYYELLHHTHVKMSLYL